MHTIRLQDGDLELELVPGIGGSVSAFRWRGNDVFRPMSEKDKRAGNVLGASSFPMVPYANRIPHNRFSFAGRNYDVAANNPPERFNVHGDGWHRPWQAVGVTTTEATLVLEPDGASGPYTYRASQRFALAGGVLEVAMKVENLGQHAMPFGFGLHPWFARKAGMTLQFTASQFYLEEPDGVSGDAVSVPHELDFSARRELPAGWRNNNYGGWDGVATLRSPDEGWELETSASDAFSHLMFYADPANTVFCVEPQTNVSGAFNRQGRLTGDDGVIVLAPGQGTEGWVRFRPGTVAA